MVESIAVVEVLIVGGRQIKQFPSQSIRVVQVAQVQGSVGCGSETEEARVRQAGGCTDHVGTQSHRRPRGRRGKHSKLLQPLGRHRGPLSPTSL